MENFIAKKSLGQNFLHAPNVVSKIVHESGVSKDSVILEVGPGKGVLTSKLLDTGAKVIAVEKDDRAVLFLNEKFRVEIERGQMVLIHHDILDFDEKINPYLSKKYTLVGNIPYYITGEFIRKFLESENQPENMVIMLQKEVARRIVTKEGVDKESILSLSIKVYGKPRYLCAVSRKLFRPIPNVDSALVSIKNISKKFFDKEKIDEKMFFKIIKAGFAHKRKKLIKNLEGVVDKKTLKEVWEKYNLDENLRAEDVTLEMWKKIVGDSCIS